ncbi:hypothetical protein IAT40_006045 [Kwoniella sp. CBS 6097]
MSGDPDHIDKLVKDITRHEVRLGRQLTLAEIGAIIGTDLQGAKAFKEHLVKIPRLKKITLRDFHAKSKEFRDFFVAS